MRGFLASLRFRLLLLVLLALVPALGLVLRTASEQRRLAGIAAQQNALSLARAAANSQDQSIAGVSHLLSVLAQLPSIREGDQAACRQTLADVLKHEPCLTAIGVANLDSSPNCGGYVSPAPPIELAASSPTLRSVLARAVETRQAVVGEYGIGPISGRGILAFANPIFDNSGRVQAVLRSTFDVTSLDWSAVQSMLPAGSTLTATDRNGTIVARFPDAEKWVGHSASQAPIIQVVHARQAEGTTEAFGEDGVRRLYAFAPLRSVPSSGIYVSVGIPADVAFAEANRMLNDNLLALGMVAALALGAAWFGGDLFFLRHIRDLLNVTGRLADGDLGARTRLHSGASEVGQLAHAFDRMVDALEQREAARQQSEEQVRRQAARAEALVKVAGRLSAQLDLRRVSEAVCEEAVHALAVQGATVMLYDTDRASFWLAASFGMPPGFAESAGPWPREAFEEWLALPELRQAAPQVRPLPDLTSPAARRDVRGIARVPLMRELELMGLLSVFALGESRELSEDDRALMRGLAAQAALAIANSRLFQTTQEQEQTRAELLHRAIEAQEEERLRIARELHDETSQSLATLMVGLDNVALQIPTDIRTATDSLRTTRFVAEAMNEDIHRLIQDLRPTLLDLMGLESAITWYGKQRLGPLGIRLVLDKEGVAGRLPNRMETALYRVAQEAFTNVVRHAHACHVTVRLARENGHIVFQVSDDGQGFDLQSCSGDRCFGLRGMQERAAILGGEFRLKTAPGAGTQIELRVPISGAGEGNHGDDSRSDR